MMNVLRKYQYHITITLAVVMIFYIVMGLGAGFFHTGATTNDPIAEVNGESIPLRIFYSHYQRALDQAEPGKPLDDAARQQRRDETMRDLVQSLIFAKEAEQYGIQVPDRQVATSLAQTPAFQEKGAFSPRLYIQALQSQIRLSPQDFEEEQRKSIAFFKLRWMIQSSIKVTDKEFEMESAFKRASLPPVKGKKPSDADVRQDLWQEKVLYSFNQWFAQLGRNLKVKTHFDLLEGQR